jgi:1,4-alpha-glucan branching enzyme
MPGDDWQKFANLRLLFGYMYGHPGKKLLFMGDEFAQRKEWNNYESLEWNLLQYAPHQGIQKWLSDLNNLYKKEPALYKRDFESQGFEWVDFHDWEKSVISFTRKGHTHNDTILVVCNFTPIPRYNYKVNVPQNGVWQELLNSDAKEYGGSGIGNLGGIVAIPSSFQDKYYTLSLALPPLGVLFFKHKEDKEEGNMPPEMGNL